MFERLLCIFVAFLSFLGVVFSSSNMDVTTDASKAIGMSNYVDVYFTNVSSSNGSKVSVSSTGCGLNLEDISLSKANETEVITYTIKNNSYNYDVMVDVTVNGEHHFEDEYFINICDNSCEKEIISPTLKA